MNQKPERMPIHFEKIPPKLTDKANWIVWRWEKRNGRWTKPPYQVNGKPAKSNDLSTWGDYPTIVSAYESGRWDGIGFMLNGQYVGIDWDDIRDSKTGIIDPEFLKKIKYINSYTEISPSGNGTKTLVKANLPANGHHNKNVGVFSTGRYFCITGNVLNGCSPHIEPRQNELNSLVKHYWPQDFKPKDQPHQHTYHPTDDISDKALTSRDRKFRSLWEGDISGYASHSEADLALCTKLAFWTGKDIQQIDVLFRKSGLYRKKWERDDYRDRTIKNAVEGTTEVFRRKSKGDRPEIPQGNEPFAEEQEKPRTESKQIPCSVSMSELCAKQFQPIQWLLPDIFPVGSTLLAGPPKLGKSVLVLNLAVAVATDGGVYGGYTCGTGDAVYLALEDNERRLQTRIKAVLNGRPPTDRMQIYHLGSEWPCLGEGCIKQLRRKIDACTNPKLVIVDTLARVRPRRERRKSQYDLDYSDLSRFHVLTSEYPGLTIIIISHTRKAAADDVFDTISGTQGLSGAVDTLSVMAGFRGKGDAKLIVAGRDVMDVNKALVYEKSTWSWNIIGDAVEITRTENQEAIFKTMQKFDDKNGLTVADITDLTGGRIKRPTIKYNVLKWFKIGIVSRISRGRYRLSAGARKANSLDEVWISITGIPY